VFSQKNRIDYVVFVFLAAAVELKPLQLPRAQPSMSAVFCGQVLISTKSATSGQSATSQCLSALPNRLRRVKFVLDGLGWKKIDQCTYYSYTTTVW